MLYTFKSKATGNLIMLQQTGDRVLGIIGKEPAPKGILLPQDMPAAIAALEQAVLQDDRQRAGGSEDRADDPSGASTDDPVSLRRRATPFLDMLRRCHQADREIVWGV